MVITGPSGVGKGTVCQELRKKIPLQYSISCTTRQPRNGEQDGVHYYFLTNEQFREKINNNEFLEYAEVYNNFYGTPKKDIQLKLQKGEDVLLEIDSAGAMQIKSNFPQAIVVLLAPPSLEELENRLRGRNTDAEEVIRYRLSLAEKELSLAKNYNYVVTNREIQQSVNEIIHIIQNEKLK